MPSSRTRRRKSRKRKPSSRKKSSSSRKRSRRFVSHPLANALSSDEDFVLESGDEDSSSDSDGSLASSKEEDTEEVEHEEGEEEDVSLNVRNDANQRSSSRPRKRRRRRRKPDYSDEEFNVHLESALNNTEPAGERQGNSRSGRTRYDLGNSEDEVDFVMDVGRSGFRERVSRPARLQHRVQKKQDSSDEDFVVNIDKGLDITDRSNESAVATRPVTRAMDAGQVFDFIQLGASNADKNLKSDLKTGESSFSIGNSSAREASSVDKDIIASKRKGKEKVLEGEELNGSLFTAELVVAAGNEDGATTAVVCGVCLSETAVVERGKLDCCDHFFCFGCIMEWAKVESRCPMCKQRFTTVAKSGSGISKRTRTVRIPLRDQVYIPPEDDFPFEDAYAEVVCMECHGTGDEGLLLLCDGCDSAAHTFCVGLGRLVPRGDWYCRDCQALIGENSDSQSEAEELVLASEDEEDHEEFLLRSIVSSENPRARQRGVQRAPISTSRVSSRPRRRLGTSGRRLWRRLQSRERRGSNRHAAIAPQLSQSARTFLSRVTPELDPVSRLSEAPQSGAARTVPQQRRLQERIMTLRNNWGRIQHGDMEFDAIRTQTTGPPHSTASFSGTAARVSSSTSPAGSGVNNRVDMDSAEPSVQGDKDLEQAWRMMGQARNLSVGTSGSAGQAGNLLAGTGGSGLHQQRSLLSHHVSKQPSQTGRSQTTASTIFRTGALPCTSEKIDRLNDALCSPPLGSNDTGIKREPKEHHEDVVTVSLSLAAKIGEDKNQEHPCSSSTADSVGFQMDSATNLQSKVGSFAAGCVEKVSNNKENTVISQAFKPPMSNSGRPSENINLVRTHNLTGDATNKEGDSHVKESNVAKPPIEGLKVHLVELVKKQTWPVYIAEKLDKEQFKRIARAAVHALLALCEPSNKSLSSSCSHFEDQGKSPVVNCCRKCFDQHVEDAVRTAKEKIVPH